MNIVKPYARMLEPLGTDHDFSQSDGELLLRRIEWCGRISHRSEDRMTEDSWRRFLQAVVIDHGDWSIVEHATITVDFMVDRGITHELVRHRLFSFTQESTRFVNYVKNMPPSFINPLLEGTAHTVWEGCIATLEAGYLQLLKLGHSPQIARSLFPNALASRIVITGNLRNWRHFLIMRTTKESHPQMRQVTLPLLAEFQSKIPLLYDDIQPGARQIDNLKKAR